MFASEIKALLQHPAISAKLNDAASPRYLAFGYTSSDSTLFSGIRQLMPGHHLMLRCDPKPRLEIERYWDVPEPPAVEEKRSDEEWIKECRRRLEETVEMRLMSDVPLGMFLSGGVDSSAIAALMKRMVTGPVKSFSVGYGEAETAANSLMPERFRGASEPNITKSSSAWMTSSTLFRISFGTKTSRSPGRPAFL